MEIILLSGGSGKRLWPLSNNQRSKQFIKVLRDTNGNLESMAQRVWKQLKDVGLQDNTLIATGIKQKSILQSQLDVSPSQIITEPSRRDTFPAIALASSYLYSEKKVDLNETVVVLPVDPFVETSFFEKVKELDSLLSCSNATLALIGIKPTYPSSKYGYIVPKNDSEVLTFKEKPSEIDALELLKKNAVWNAGVFGFKLRTMIELLENNNLPTTYNNVKTNYDKLTRNSFDYEFVEKQNEILYTTYDGYWKDLGTWNTLTEEMGTKTVGVVETIDSINTHIINESNLPVATIGVEDLVIAAGSEGILISKKELSPRVKEIDESFFESINYREEDWGAYRVIQESDNSSIEFYELQKDKQISLDLKPNQKIVRLSGESTITRKNNFYKITADENVFKFVIVTEDK